MKKQTKKGFTLVELVIVIAVIAILSAILIPTFGNVISQAKENAAQEDARTAYQQILIDYSSDDVVTDEKNTAYILVGVTVESNKISAATVYSFKNGTLKKEAALTDDLKVDVVSASLTKTTKFEANKAYKLSKEGMYVVFLAPVGDTTTGGNAGN